MVRFSHIAASVGVTIALMALSACTTPGKGMFNGRDLAGWELVTVQGAPLADSFTVRPDGVIASTGNPTGYLATKDSYRDYRLHVEWRWSGKPGNAGVLLHIEGGPKDRAWPLSIQVQTKQGSVGDVLPMAGASFTEPLTSAPGASPSIKARLAADSEKAVGEWNSADIVSRAGTLEVTVNGVLQNRVRDAKPAQGRIGFQLEGAPFELRNVTLVPAS